MKVKAASRGQRRQWVRVWNRTSSVSSGIGRTTRFGILSHEGNGHGNPTWRHEHAQKSAKQSQIINDERCYLQKGYVQKMAVAGQRNKANLHGFFIKRGAAGWDGADRLCQNTCVRPGQPCPLKTPQKAPEEAPRVGPRNALINVRVTPSLRGTRGVPCARHPRR